MMYEVLAKYYDRLIGDDSFYKWVSFTKKFIKGKKILELASGSGDIANKLSEDYDIIASDLSNDMLEVLKKKYPHLEARQIDMRSFSGKYDGIICYCDSINYLTSLQDLSKMFKCAYNCLNDGGIFIFDMHSIDRLEEFKDGYIEEGFIDDVAYQWTINSEDDFLHHHLAFYIKDKTLEEFHLQKVFKLEEVLNLLSEIGFSFEVYTDFKYHGVKKGEKYFIVGGKNDCIYRSNG